MLHVPGFGFNGLRGFSPIGVARQAIGLGLATEKFGSKFFGNGAKSSVILEHPNKLDDPTAARIAASWDAAHGGLENSHKAAVLEEGMKVTQTSIPNDDAQFLETRKFQVSEIARLYRVPPHMIGDLERATFSNIEQMSLEFVIYSLLPWIKRWEQELNRKLLTEDEKRHRTVFIKFNLDFLMRGDSQARSEFYNKLFTLGSMSPNDIREFENMNPVDKGDQYFVPLNMVPLAEAGIDQFDDDVPPENNSGPGNQNRLGAAVHRALAPHQLRSVKARKKIPASPPAFVCFRVRKDLKRELEQIRKLANKHLADTDTRAATDFTTAITEFYNTFAAVIARQLQPVVQALTDITNTEAAGEVNADPMTDQQVETFSREYVDNAAKRHIASSRGQLDALAAGADPCEAVATRLGEWEETRAGKSANRETVETGSAAAKAVYILAGVTTLRWVTVGENCPLCAEMNGRIVGTQR